MDDDIRLFDMTTGVPPIGRGCSFRVSMVHRRRCIPTTLRLSLDVLEAFRLRGVFVGCEPMVLETKPAEGSTYRHLGHWSKRAIVLDVGVDFSIEAENISDAPLAFKCEVWGQRGGD